jgi:predicted cupin superfamily sugar epimerase
MDAERIVERLGLSPHPEGGWYRETWRGRPGPDGRAVGTSILFLLAAGRPSRWHRVDADEVWAWHGGAPLELRISPTGVAVERTVLGMDLAAGERPQAVVPAGAWQAARTLGEWTLVGCAVAPGFEPEGFELAPDGWRPGGGDVP